MTSSRTLTLDDCIPSYDEQESDGTAAPRPDGNVQCPEFTGVDGPQPLLAHDPAGPPMELFWHRLQADLKLGVSMEDALRQWATSCRAETIPVAEALTYATSGRRRWGDRPLGLRGRAGRRRCDQRHERRPDPPRMAAQAHAQADGGSRPRQGLRTILTCDSRIKGRIRWDTFWDRQR